MDLLEAPPTSDNHTPCEVEKEPTPPLTTLSPSSHSHQDNVVVSFYSAGTVVGDLEVLEGQHRSQVVSIECETPVWVCGYVGMWVCGWQALTSDLAE